MLQLRLLGTPEITLAGQPPAGPLSSKAQAILYYLAVTGQPQTRSVLATLLWGDMPEAAARTNLRKALADLRRELAPYLQIERQSVDFKPEIDLWVDVVEFETILGHIPENGEPRRLQEAIDLYRDDFLTGFYVRNALDFEEWMFTEQARLRELMIQALHTLAGQVAEQGDLAEGIATARRLLSLEPWREEAHRQLMRWLAEVGQRGAALAQFETCRQALDEELGVEPGRETVVLYERIRDEELSRGAEERRGKGEIVPATPVPASPSPPAHNLPQQPTSFIGREKELADIRHLLLEEHACRMVTLVGPGGVGKTRLALAAAAEVVEAFPQGVYFVSLVPVKQAEFIVSAIADALNFNFSGGLDPTAQLLNHLRDERLLLVLDNFEHLLPPPPSHPDHERADEAPLETEVENSPELLSEILSAAPKVTLLVTSRERLKLQEEWGYEVQGLGFPKMGDGEMERWGDGSLTEDDPDRQSTLPTLETYSAVHLFVQRARRAEANFSLAAEDMPDIVRICQLLEGMPLGLELAAPWVRLMTCREIVQEIERNLDFLTTTMRNVPDRHRSLRAILEQTWHRLPTAEQRVLAQLSIFDGGCRREAAEQVAGASLPVLASLLDKALLRRTPSGRYELHELIRQFALEQLQTNPDEYTSLRGRHAHFYTVFMHHRETDLKGRRQREGLAEIGADLDNIRAAWGWSVTHKDVAAVKRSVESLFLFYEMRGLTKEGEAAFRRAAAVLAQGTPAPSDPAQTVVLGQVLGRQGSMAIRLGHYDEGIQLMRQGAALLRQVEAEAERELAWALCYLGEEIYFQGDYQQSQQLLQESLHLATKIGDPWQLGVTWQCLGQTAEFQGDYTAAEPYFQKSLAALETLGEQRAKSFAQNNWGRVAYATGAYARAEQLINAALQVREALQDNIGIAYSCLDLGKLATMRGAYEEARKHTERGLKICEEIGERDLMARCLNGWGIASRLLGDYTRAEAEHQQSLSIYTEIGVKRDIPFTLNNLGQVAFDQGDYQRAQERFQESLRLSQELENKIEMASAWRHLGHLAGVMEQEAEAQQYYRQALDIVTQTGAAPVALDIFLGWADLLKRNNPTQAVELLSFVQHHPAATHETREKAGRRLLDDAADLPTEVMAKAKSQAPSLDWQTVARRMIENRADFNGNKSVTAIYNLPQQSTPFVGRATELADIIRRLTDRDCRLLTLIGPGGIGKTRLALQTAQTFVETGTAKDFFPHGLIFVSLVGVSSPNGLVSVIAEAAKFSFYNNVPPRQQLLDYLQEKRMLLILDNLEHLLTPPTNDGSTPSQLPPFDRLRTQPARGRSQTLLPGDDQRKESGGADLIADILAAAPAVKILVTSREALNLQEAWFHPVQGMPFPAGEAQATAINPTNRQATHPALESYDAVRLFVQSAHRARVDFSLTAEQAHVARICRLVDGLPLAIELAAAWLKVLPAEKIAAEIEHSLDFLTTRHKNLPERHHSIRAVFEHSWHLLNDQERNVLKRLSVFQGSFDQEAAEQVAGASLPVLAVLVEKSLLRVTESARYQLHELLHQFAAEKLAQDSVPELATRKQHSAYYLDFLKTRETMLTSQEQPVALTEIGQEIENVRAAWRWAVEQNDLAAIQKTLAGYFNFYLIRSRLQEGEETFAHLLEHLQRTNDLLTQPRYEVIRARAMIRRGTFCYFLGEYEAANRYVEQGLQTELDREYQSDVAFAYLVLGVVAGWQGKKELAQEHLSQSLTLSQEIGDQENIADALHELAQIRSAFGDYREAKRLAQESVVVSRAHGRPDWVAHALDTLGWATVCLGDYAEAEAYWREALAIFETLGSRHGMAHALGGLGWVAWCQGETHLEEAKQYLEQSLTLVRRIGHRLLISNFLGDLALVTNDLGNYAQAQEYSREGLRLAQALDSSVYTAYHLCCLGDNACGRSDYTASRRYLSEALQVAVTAQLLPTLGFILFTFATLLVKENEATGSHPPVNLRMKALALELTTVVIHHPATWQGVRDRATRLQNKLEAELPADVAATAKAQAESKTLDEVVTELLSTQSIGSIGNRNVN